MKPTSPTLTIISAVNIHKVSAPLNAATICRIEVAMKAKTADCDTRRAPNRSTIAAFEKLAIAMPIATMAKISGNIGRAPNTPAMICSLLLRSEEHTSELQSLMRNSYAVFCLKTKTQTTELPQHSTNSYDV